MVSRKEVLARIPALCDPNQREDFGTTTPDSLGALETGESDVVFDASERTQQLSAEFNASIATYTLDDDGNVQYVTPVDNPAEGVPNILAVDMSDDDDPLRELLESTMNEHLAHPSPGDPRGNCVVLIDPCTDDNGLPSLPPWNPHGPDNHNVVLAVIASRTYELRPLRGGYTIWVIAEQIVKGEIETICSLRKSPRCTPNDPRYIFTLSWGNYLVFFRLCALCYFDYVERSTSVDGGCDYDCIDPREYGEPEYRDGDLGDSAGTISP